MCLLAIKTKHYSCSAYLSPVSSGPIYKISYDLLQDYRKFIVRSTYNSDLQRAKSCLANIVS